MMGCGTGTTEYVVMKTCEFPVPIDLAWKLYHDVKSIPKYNSDMIRIENLNAAIPILDVGSRWREERMFRGRLVSLLISVTNKCNEEYRVQMTSDLSEMHPSWMRKCIQTNSVQFQSTSPTSCLLLFSMVFMATGFARIPTTLFSRCLVSSIKASCESVMIDFDTEARRRYSHQQQHQPIIKLSRPISKCYPLPRRNSKCSKTKRLTSDGTAATCGTATEQNET